MAAEKKFSDYLDEHIKVVTDLKSDTLLISSLEYAISEIVKRLKLGGKLLVCGNGGSAADSQHIVAELVGTITFDRAPIAALSLTTNTSVLTAWSNDKSFDDVFARQVAALGRSNDILFGISTSGSSRNVLEAFKVAGNIGILSIGVTGRAGAEIDGLADIVLNANSESTPLIQAAHIIMYHYICARIEILMQ